MSTLGLRYREEIIETMTRESFTSQILRGVFDIDPMLATRGPL